MKKSLLAILLVLCTLAGPLWLSGCGKKDTATVYMTVDTEAEAAAFGKAAKAYEKETGGKVRITTAPADAGEKAKNLSSKSETPCVFLFGGMKEYEVLKKYCADVGKSKVFSHIADKSLALGNGDGGEILAVPYSITGYGIICNKKIIDRYFKAGKADFRYSDISDITDFESLKEFSADLHNRRGELELDSAFASPSLKGDDGWYWNSGILNLPLYYEFSENDDYNSADEAFYNSKEITLRYDREYRDLTDLVTGNSTDKTLFENKDAAGSVTEFALGKAAMMLGSDKEWDKIKTVSGKTVSKDDVVFLPLYIDASGDKRQGITIKKERYFAVNRQADEKSREAALDFLDWVFTSSKGKKVISEDLGILTPFDTFGEDELPDDPLKRETLRYLKDNTVKNVLWVIGEPIKDAAKSAASAAATAYITGKKAFDETKDVIRDSFRKENR